MKLKSITISLIAAATLFACEKKETPQINLPDEQKQIVVSAFAGEETINIKANTTPNVNVMDDAKSWLSVNITKSLTPSIIHLNFTQNDTGDKRVGSIIVTGENVEPQTIVVAQYPRTFKQNGVLTLHEGNWNQGNSKLGFIDENNTVTPNFFGDNNNGDMLGDITTDVINYGAKTYVVANGSEQIQVINTLSGKLLASINTKKYNNDQKVDPRYALGTNGKVYVTTWHKGLLVIDTTELKIIKDIDLSEAYHEQIVANKDNIYVANSGRETDPFGGAGTTISIIPISTEIESETIKVPSNPNRLGFDKNGKLYVATWVNYVIPNDDDAMLHQIDVNTKKIIHTFPISVGKFAITDNNIFTYHFSYITSKPYTTKIDVATNLQSDYNKTFSAYGIESLYDISAVNNTLYFLANTGAIVKASVDGVLMQTYPTNGTLNGNKVIPIYTETTVR